MTLLVQFVICCQIISVNQLEMDPNYLQIFITCTLTRRFITATTCFHDVHLIIILYQLSIYIFVLVVEYSSTWIRSYHYFAFVLFSYMLRVHLITLKINWNKCKSLFPTLLSIIFSSLSVDKHYLYNFVFKYLQYLLQTRLTSKGLNPRQEKGVQSSLYVFQCLLVDLCNFLRAQ